MTTLGRAASVSLLALLEACTFTFDRALAPGELRGSVVYLSTTGSEVPAAGAHVVLEETSLTLTADSNGRFVFANLPAGTYALTITASTTASGAVDTGIRLQNLTLAALSGGEASGLDLGTIQLAAFGGIAGSVTVNGTGTAGASAILVDIAEAAVTPTGFDFQNLPEGDYELVVLAPGSDGTVLATTGQTVQVSPRQTTQLGTIALTSSDLALSGALQGAVTVEGSGNQTVTIQISSASNPDVATLTSNAQGEYSTPALPPGVYTVTASAPGYQPVSVPYVVVTGMTTTVPRILLSLMASASADAGTNPDGGADDAGPDGGPADAGLPDAGSRDAGSSDAGTLDAGSRDAGMVDAGPSDGGVFDGGALDAGPDAGPSDAGSIDAGSIDAGSIDAGSVDAGASDAGGGVVDAGFPDAGPSDSGVADAGPPPACVIGGTIQGASGRVSLEENGAGQIAPGNGPFYFPGDVSNGSSYSVTVVGSPSGQTCSVQHGSGFAFQNRCTRSVSRRNLPASSAQSRRTRGR